MTLVLVVLQSLQSQTNVTFVNTGQMYVAASSPSSRVSLYVPDAMRQLTVAGSSVEIIQNGITELGGNFYQDAQTTVFAVDATTKTTSTGKFRFVKDYGVNRIITTQSVNLNTFDRGLYYIAFPQFEISTNDSVELPGRMGIDAIDVHRVNGKTGKLVLRSDVVGSNAYDASLRITKAGASASVVDLGAVIVERDMTLYRPINGSTQMFGFATPFKNTHLSGTFAGNWVRRPLNTGTYGHTTYVYGNKDNSPADGTIDVDQYVYLAAEKLNAAQAYLIKPRPRDYGYDNLKTSSGLWYTGEPNPSLYDKGKFKFNGKVYTVTPYYEQLFADDVLYSNSISNPSLSSTVNWLIGNSYTAPISTKLLAQAMENSNLTFAPYIYVFPAGSTTYVPYAINGTGNDIMVTDVTEIPAMSVFMVRVSKGQAQNGSLSIGKDLLRHADVSHNNPLSTKGISKSKAASPTNQIVFRVSAAGNDNIFDLAAIGLRETASTGSDNFDMAKAYVNDDNIFQLYTLSSTQTKLSANGLPLNADSIVLAFNPSQYGGSFNLSSKYAETLTTEGVWVLDTKNQELVDLKSTNNYAFTAEPTDKPERFLISFKKPIITATKSIINLKLDVFYNDNSVRIKQLESRDLGSIITIYNTQGKQLSTIKVSNYPEININVSGLSSGVYLVKIKGERTAFAKFVVN